MNNFGMTERK